MGSEGPKAVTIHVTGFKKFQGVAENPTDLKDFVERRGLPPGATLGSSTVIETAGDGALPLLYQTLESGVSRTTSNEQVVWVSNHFPLCNS
jgi:pyroglutamyl-peptidase